MNLETRSIGHLNSLGDRQDCLGVDPVFSNPFGAKARKPNIAYLITTSVTLAGLLTGGSIDQEAEELVKSPDEPCSGGILLEDATLIIPDPSQHRRIPMITRLNRRGNGTQVTVGSVTFIRQESHPLYSVDIDEHKPPQQGDGILEFDEWEVLNPQGGFVRNIIIAGDPRGSNRRVLLDNTTQITPPKKDAGVLVCMDRIKDAKPGDPHLKFFYKSKIPIKNATRR